MDRRQAVRLLGSATAVPFLTTATLSELLAFGREARRADEARGALAGGGGADGRPAAPGAWAPRTLDPHQDATVVALAEVIIPETDTPGATTARVNEFVDLILTEWLEEAETAGFLDGLGELDARCRERYESDFIECTAEQKIAMTAALDAEVEALRQTPGGQPGGHWFFQMKRLTVAGFFTSDVGQELVGWEAIPGELVGCTLLPGYR